MKAHADISRPHPSSLPASTVVRAGRLIAALCCLVLATTAARAGDKYAAMVIDANTGRTLIADAADAPRYPASLTKLMTLYLAFEAVRQGRTTFESRISISDEAASRPPSKLGLKPGSTIRLIDAVKILITKSANDVAVAVAEHLSGSEVRFARQMTEKARRLGMRHTVFRNASGLPDAAQVTTARDILKLAQRLYDDFPRASRLFALKKFTYRGRTYRNHNTLLRRFRGTNGLKTGYTRASGYNLVASVRRGRRHVIGVVFGGKTGARRDARLKKHLTRALLRASPTKTRTRPPVLVAAPRRAAPRRAVPPRPLSRTPAHRQATARAWPRPQVTRGAPPSTLQQQAANLARGLPPHPTAARPRADRRIAPGYGLRGPQLRDGTHEIQIGAYSTNALAHEALQRVRATAGTLLRPYATRTETTQTASGTIYRSRFAGFDANSASQVCNELRRRAIDCFVARSH